MYGIEEKGDGSGVDGVRCFELAVSFFETRSVALRRPSVAMRFLVLRSNVGCLIGAKSCLLVSSLR